MIGEIWDLVILQPVINSLIMLSSFMFGSFGLAIITLTIAVNVLMYPLTMKQLKATTGMQSLQPQLAELQKKYAKDKAKLAQEQMRLYKESGLSPGGCLVPMLIQLPVWIALFQSIMRLVAVIPENLMGLSRYLYSWPAVYSTLPLQNEFLWWDLAVPDFFLAILVGATMWLQQKMVMSPTADPKQQAQGRLMLWMMPMMFAFICLSFPSGLALYWVTSSIIRIGIQYYITGWGGLGSLMPRKPATRDNRDKKLKRRIAAEGAQEKEAPVSADIVEPVSPQEEELGYERSGDESQDRGRGYPTYFKEIRRHPGKSRGHRPKRR